MPSGKVGDHPYTGIVVHGREVYSPKADALVREIASLATDRIHRELQDRLMSEFNDYQNPDVKKLERVLTDLIALIWCCASRLTRRCSRTKASCHAFAAELGR